ncbi:MAG TPA: hypothetical protein VGK73_07135 [Polyangiaceae bacterium]
MRAGLPFALLVLTLSSVAAGQADVQRVVLLRPGEDDAVLVDAFHRVEAELRIHRFETEVVEADPGAEPSAVLGQVAEAEKALASIGFVRHAGKTSVEVWLVDRVSGKTTMRRLEVGKSRDAANVLAIRTVDLLRMSLSEYDPEEPPPPDVVGVERRPLPEAVQKLATPETSFRLRVEAMSVYDGPAFGFAYGPALGIHHVSAPLEFGVMLAGPLLGGEVETSLGTASVWQELGWLEARLAAVERARFRLQFSAGGGVHLMQARGQANPPLLSRSDSVVSAIGALGLHAELGVSRSVGFAASVRALGLFPPLGVAVLSEREELGIPLFVASLGVTVGW